MRDVMAILRDRVHPRIRDGSVATGCTDFAWSPARSTPVVSSRSRTFAWPGQTRVALVRETRDPRGRQRAKGAGLRADLHDDALRGARGHGPCGAALPPGHAAHAEAVRAALWSPQPQRPTRLPDAWPVTWVAHDPAARRAEAARTRPAPEATAAPRATPRRRARNAADRDLEIIAGSGRKGSAATAGGGYGAQSPARSSSSASKGSTRTTASARNVATSSHPRSWRRSTSTLRSVGDTSHTCATPSRR